MAGVVGHSAVRHCRDKLRARALRRHSAVGHWHTLSFGLVEMHLGTAPLQAYPALGDCRRMFCGWARRGYSTVGSFAVGHCVEGKDNIAFLTSGSTRFLALRNGGRM